MSPRAVHMLVGLGALLSSNIALMATALPAYSGGKNAAYYADLRAQCMEQAKGPCCIQSVDIMEEGGLKLAPKDGRCGKGMKADTLECMGAYTWCEPAAQKSE